MSLVWTVFILLMLGCSAIRPDPSPSAIDSNYPTAEFWAGGRLLHGLGFVLLTEGKPYNDVKLAVQGYYKGVVRVDSTRCDVGQAWNYVDSDLLNVNIPGTSDQSCLLDILVQPQYPEESGSGIDIDGFRGQLLVKVLSPGVDWAGFANSVKAGSDKRIWIPFSGMGKVQVVFRGCGASYDQVTTIVNNTVPVSLNDVAGDIGQRRCTFTGFVRQDSRSLRVDWLVWGYAQAFTPLAVPSIKKTGVELKVRGEEAVSIIALDKQYKMDNEGEFFFNEISDHTLRLLTTKGRSVVCRWELVTKDWQCQN